MPSNGRRRRRPCRGPVAKKYFQTTWKNDPDSQFLRRREFRFAVNFVDGLVQILPALGDISQKRLGKVLNALAKDSITLSGYRIRGEKDLAKQAAYLMNMPRVQQEIERHMGLRGLGMDRIAKTLADIMNGTATVKTKKFDGEGNLVEMTEAQPGIGDRLRAIDLRIRATTGYAPTSSRVAVGVANMSTYDAAEFETTPEIAIDPAIALEAKENVIEHEPMFEEEEHPEDCDCDDCGDWDDDDEDDEDDDDV